MPVLISLYCCACLGKLDSIESIIFKCITADRTVLVINRVGKTHPAKQRLFSGLKTDV
jgi:hypothetical protein